MSDGLIARLRSGENQAEHAAADEIERLRTVIREAVSDLAGGANFYCVCPEVMDRLSAALPPTPEALEYLQTLKEKDND